MFFCFNVSFRLHGDDQSVYPKWIECADLPFRAQLNEMKKWNIRWRRKMYQLQVAINYAWYFSIYRQKYFFHLSKSFFSSYNRLAFAWMHGCMVHGVCTRNKNHKYLATKWNAQIICDRLFCIVDNNNMIHCMQTFSFIAYLLLAATGYSTKTFQWTENKVERSIVPFRNHSLNVAHLFWSINWVVNCSCFSIMNHGIASFVFMSVYAMLYLTKSNFKIQSQSL